MFVLVRDSNDNNSLKERIPPTAIYAYKTVSEAYQTLQDDMEQYIEDNEITDPLKYEITLKDAEKYLSIEGYNWVAVITDFNGLYVYIVKVLIL